MVALAEINPVVESKLETLDSGDNDQHLQPTLAREVGAERNDPSQLRQSKAPPAHAAASQPQQGPTTWS